MTVVTGVLLTFWVGLLLQGTYPVFGVLSMLSGPLLLLFLPGALLAGRLGIEDESPGRFLLYAVGLSVALLAVETVLASLVFPVFGVRNPISVFPLSIVCSVTVLGLAALVRTGDVRFPPLEAELAMPSPVVGLLISLPIVSALAAETMNRWQANVGMFLFVGLVVLLVVISAFRFLPVSLYPAAIFSVSLSTLLHRNLLSDHVVGADIQALFAVSQHVAEVGTWTPGLVGSTSAIPVVTTVPAAVSVLLGVTVASTFKTVYVFVFSLTPVGLYYVVRDVFDDDVALYGSLFFSFFHVSFFFTPGKQLVSELFVVLLLLTLWSDASRPGRIVSAALLSTALVLTHYGMTYTFGFSLLAAAVGLAVGRHYFDRFGWHVPVGFPAVFLLAATTWYGYASPDVLALIASIPLRLLNQVALLFATGAVEGSGASYASAQTTLLEAVHLALYVLLTVFVAIGIGWRSIDHLRRLWRGDDPGRVDHTAIALPLFAFLGASYVFVFNLWADRVYQLVLVVLAPFMPYGYRLISTKVDAVRRRKAGGGPTRPYWLGLAILLALLLAFNSGMALALTGPAETSTFNPDANDLVFGSDEMAAANWIKQQPGVDRIDVSGQAGESPGAADTPDRVVIYTDPVSAQLFRAVLHERYYTVDVVQVKSRWRPSFDRSTLGPGYVFVRKESIRTAPEQGTVPPSYFTRAEVATIEDAGEVVYRNDDVVIYEVDDPADS